MASKEGKQLTYLTAGLKASLSTPVPQAQFPMCRITGHPVWEPVGWPPTEIVCLSTMGMVGNPDTPT